MGYHYYLANKEEKVLVDVGNHIDEESFNVEYKDYEKFREEINSDEMLKYELLEKKRIDLTIEDFSKLIECYKLVLKMTGLLSRLMALEYKYIHYDEKLEYVGEEDLGKFEDYKLI